MQLSEVWIRNYTGSASYAEKVARLHASKFGNVQGKCFHICWSFCCFRSSTLPCPKCSFLAPEIGYFLETRWGPPLFEAPGCHLAVAMSCVTLLYVADSNNTIQESIWVGRQTGSQGGTGFRMLRAQFWTLAQSKCILKGVQKWTLLGSKVVPPGGSVFGPFISSDVLKLCRLPCAQDLKLEATLTQTASAAGILNWAGSYLRL